MKKQFTLKMQGKTIIDIEVEGDEDIIKSFCKEMFLDSMSLFYKMKDDLSEFYINGIKSQYKIVARDEKGHFINPLKKP